jgi:endoglucanase
MRRNVLKIAEELLSLPTAPFREGRVREHIRAFCAARGIATREDGFGNVIATYGPECRGPVLAFDAHMDHPGFIIEKDSSRGSATAQFYGGVDERYFRGSAVRVFTDGREVAGRVTATRFNRAKRIKRVRLALEGDVKRGDVAMWDLPAFRVRGGRIHSRGCDDVIGCVSVLALFDELIRRRVRRKALGVFTVAEECGLNGAKYLAAGRGIAKSAHIVAIETSRELPNARIGDGAVIRVGDSRSIFSPAMTSFMVDVAAGLRKREPKFRSQRRLMDGGSCQATVYQAFGYTAGAACVPLGNYHNRDFARGKIAAEYVSVDDLVNMVRLFAGMVERSRDLPKFLRPRPPRYTEERRALGVRLLR